LVGLQFWDTFSKANLITLKANSLSMLRCKGANVMITILVDFRLFSAIFAFSGDFRLFRRFSPILAIFVNFRLFGRFSPIFGETNWRLSLKPMI
jgi:hypothetical protein